MLLYVKQLTGNRNAFGTRTRLRAHTHIMNQTWTWTWTWMSHSQSLHPNLWTMRTSHVTVEDTQTEPHTHLTFDALSRPSQLTSSPYSNTR